MVVEAKPITNAVGRVTMLLWGDPGCGKTHLAGTAPGKILWINFDPEGTTSLDKGLDVIVKDYSNEPMMTVCNEAKSINPFDIEGEFQRNPDIQTVVLDSMTAFGTMATANAVKSAPGATFDNPGPSAYGMRNRYVLGLVRQTLFITGKHNKHCIIICHEDVPKTDDKGQPVSITILLGGSLPAEVPLQISEVWHMRDTVKDRVITIRTVGLRKPMKSRMFLNGDGFEFVTSTKANPSKVELGPLFDKWVAGGYKKLPIPV